ncbi:hypothetical protein Tco_0632682 [Tanacetum coccineum]
MFDEFFNPPLSVVSPVPVAPASRLADPTEHSHDIEVAHLDNNPFFSIPIPEPNYEESSSRDVIPTNLHSVIDHLNISVNGPRIIRWIMLHGLAFADADHAGCQDTRRSTSGSMQLLGDRLLADIFTKALRRERLEFLINKLKMGSMSPETLKGLVEEDED